MLDEIDLSTLDIMRLKKGNDLMDEDGNVKYENKLLTLDPHPHCSYAFFSDTRLQ